MENSGPLSDPEKIAEYLNIHFTNVGPKRASEILTVDCDVNPADSQQRVNSSFELKEVTISDVFKKLQEVNVAKATGSKVQSVLVSLSTNFLLGEIIYKVSDKRWGVALEFLR
ncbi:unnamed protein product [Porites lobata]|uniref:Uncharacterized protein n=1 Tax=Porites lobata TaxID=104759 RepID=A0ABN8PQ27_9CNID|nr:unnamed protein product [Porites lobata]